MENRFIKYVLSMFKLALDDYSDTFSGAALNCDEAESFSEPLVKITLYVLISLVLCMLAADVLGWRILLQQTVFIMSTSKPLTMAWQWHNLQLNIIKKASVCLFPSPCLRGAL